MPNEGEGNKIQLHKNQSFDGMPILGDHHLLF